MRVFPENPYYNLAAAIFILETSEGSPDDFDDFENSLDCIADSADGLSEVCADLLAKIGFVATARGMWSIGMSYFVEAIKAREELDNDGSRDLMLLWDTNDASLELYLKSLERLDGRRVFGYSFEDIPLETVVQTICILLIAYGYVGIHGAWPICRPACTPSSRNRGGMGKFNPSVH
jgi:hypothetical protein